MKSPASIIFLTGFMGSGKTYWGRKLADAIDRPFYDLDQLIESRQQQSVAAVFSEAGEATFRELERETLHQTTALPPAIVATGGGTPCFFDNMTWMNEVGLTIFLDTPAAILADRLKHERAFRPLLATVNEPAPAPDALLPASANSAGTNLRHQYVFRSVVKSCFRIER